MKHLIVHPDGEQLVMRAILLGSQLSDVLGGVKHLVRGIDANIQLKLLEGSLGDVIVQTEFLCRDLGLSIRSVRSIGYARYHETKEEWERRGRKDKWI